MADPGFTNGGQGGGAAGAEGVGCGERFFFDFGSQNGNFRCILGTIFFTVQLFGLNTKSNAFWLGKLAVACTQRV